MESKVYIFIFNYFGSFLTVVNVEMNQDHRNHWTCCAPPVLQGALRLSASSQ